MQKYCRKMKKRRVNFSLLRANEVGNTEALLSILWASVVRKCTFGCRHWPRADALLFSFIISDIP